MSKPLEVWVCNLIFFVFATGAQGLTIPASEDTTGYKNLLTKAAGSSTLLTVDLSRTAYLYFDLNDIPADAVLRWAKLRLYLPAVRNRGSGLGVYRATSEWNEALASQQPGLSAGTVGLIGPEKIAAKRFVTVDVTATVQDWISGKSENEGFAILPLPGGAGGVTAVSLTSKDGPVFGLPGELDLDFQQKVEPAPPLTVSQLPPELTAWIGPTFSARPSVSAANENLTAEVRGAGTFSYQWLLDGKVLAGGSGATLSLVGLSSGSYSLRVSNGFATATSGEVKFDGVIARGGLVAAGSFTMGNNVTGDGVEHVVYVSGFYSGKTEVTEGEWHTVKTWATAKGYAFDNQGSSKGNEYPVTNVNWLDAVKWCNARSERENLTPAYHTAVEQSSGNVLRSGTLMLTNEMVDWTANGYRLPTEAEWEKAARGGLGGQNYPNGPILLANFADKIGPAGRGGEVSAAESFAANGFGLYGMAGNVAEWCWDRHGNVYSGPDRDPRGPNVGDYRVSRGGAFGLAERFCRVSYRDPGSPSAARADRGFRVVRGALPSVP